MTTHTFSTLKVWTAARWSAEGNTTVFDAFVYIDGSRTGPAFLENPTRKDAMQMALAWATSYISELT